MMPRPATRSNRQIATAYDLALRLMYGCLPDFAGWSGYPSIAALSINLGIDVMGHWTLPRPTETRLPAAFLRAFCKQRTEPPQLLRPGFARSRDA
jgi:hypothetical protein